MSPQGVMEEMRPAVSRRVPREEPADLAPPKATPGPKVRLVHVTTVAGTLGFLRGQVGHLKSRGFEVWAMSSPSEGLDRFAREEGIRSAGIEMARRITPWADFVSLIRMWWAFVRIRPHVVHGHTPKGGLLSMVAAFLAGVPTRIYTVHGLPLETARGWKRSLLRWTERISSLFAHRVHSVSPSLTRRIVEEGLCSKSKLLRLGEGTINGVDATRRFVPGADHFKAAREFRHSLGLHPQTLVIGFVGRVVRDKGLAELVSAWSSLRLAFPEAHLVIAGTFEPQDPLPAETEAALRKDPKVHLLGHVASVPTILAAMDVVVLPTYREGFPQVPLEAAAMERPVVATRVTGCVDAVQDGTTGLLVPPRDGRALAAAIRSYLENPHLRQAHGRAGRIRALRDFKPENLWDAWEGEYRRPARREAPKRSRATSRDSEFRRLELFIKRLLDVGGAAAVLVAAAPLLGLIAGGTLLTLGRPLLFRQVRPGLKGRPFTPLKFRTMRNGPGRDHERVTRLGRLLRHLSLDELPQLWNVVRGEMSLVGPRPLLMAYLKRYTPRLAKRHDMLPGLTGWCQVNGRNDLDWNRKFEFDVWYVENWSLRLDVRILLMTIVKVLRKSGVEGPGSRCWPEALKPGGAAEAHAREHP